MNWPTAVRKSIIFFFKLFLFIHIKTDYCNLKLTNCLLHSDYFYVEHKECVYIETIISEESCQFTLKKKKKPVNLAGDHAKIIHENFIQI